MFFLAQAAPNPSVAWNVVLTLGVLIAISVNLVSLIRKPSTAITPDPLRIEKLDKFATRDFCNVKHTDIQVRLERIDHEIGALWATVRTENENIRNEVRKGFQDIERSLGRIEGKLSKTKDV